MRVEMIDKKGREISVSRRDARLLIAIGKATLKPTVAPAPVAAIMRAEPAPVSDESASRLKDALESRVKFEETSTPAVPAPDTHAIAAEVLEAEVPVAAEPQAVPEVAPHAETPAETETDPPTDETDQPAVRVKRKYTRRDLTAEPAGEYKTRDMKAES